MQFASVLAAFQKNGIKITNHPTRKKHFHAQLGDRMLMFYVNDDSEVDHFTAESPDTDVQRDYFADSYFYTIRSALHYLNPSGVLPTPTNIITDGPVPDVQVQHNEMKGGIEIKFAQKPTADVIKILKARDFRWSAFHGVWWKKFTHEDMTWAQEKLVHVPV